MTKTLTEQWRDGMLPRGHYYCKLYYNDFEPRIQECVKSRYDSKSCIPMSCGCEGEEVLAQVPSYNEVEETSKKIEILENKLDIAVKALKFIFAQSYGKDMYDSAKEALEKIEEFEK